MLLDGVLYDHFLPNSVSICMDEYRCLEEIINLMKWLIKSFDSTSIVYILKHRYNMIFKVHAKIKFLKSKKTSSI